jgi:AMMECR1 domain-containing protein
VLAPGGLFVLTDQCSAWLLPSVAVRRRDRARTPLQATRLLATAGFRSLRWHRLYAVIIRTVTATP